MNREQLLAPYWFRFTEPDDVKKYGKDWYVYDESAIVRLPANLLVAYERIWDAPLVEVLNGMRVGSVFGNLAGAWLAVRQAGRDVAWDGFSPVVVLLEWTTENPHPTNETVGKDDSPAPIQGDMHVLDSSPLAE